MDEVVWLLVCMCLMRGGTLIRGHFVFAVVVVVDNKTVFTVPSPASEYFSL